MIEAFGRYQIDSEVAKGAMSTVYRARDQDLDRRVALKVIDPDWLTDLAPPEISRRLKAGAEWAANLNHAAISRVRDVGEVEGMFFVSTDWVEGRALHALVRDHGPLPFLEACRVTLDVLAGLGHGHQQGVLHGAVTLENLMLTHEGKGVLTDWGVTRDFAPAEAPVEERWAPEITSLAPEVVLGEAPGPASDIYGMGVALYEMLGGRPAFPVDEGADPYDEAARRVEHPPPRLPRDLPGVPAEMSDLVHQAMARDPRARFETANDFTRAIIALAVRYRVDIPDRVPLDSVPGRYAESRARSQKALDAPRSAAARPSAAALAARAARRRARVVSWATSLGLLAGLVGYWWVLTRRVAYLSVGVYPAGAAVVARAAGEAAPGAGAFDAGSAVNFQSFMRGPVYVYARWPGEAEVRRVGPVELAAGTHLDLNIGRDGGVVRRRVRVWVDLIDTVRRAAQAWKARRGAAASDAGAPGPEAPAG